MHTATTPTTGLLAPSCKSPFRKTRSGLGFSPWTRNLGEPIHAPLDFDMAARLRDMLDNSSGAPSAPAAPSAMDPDDPEVTDPPIPRGACKTPPETDPFAHLFEGFARLTTADSHRAFGASNDSACDPPSPIFTPPPRDVGARRAQALTSIQPPAHTPDPLANPSGGTTISKQKERAQRRAKEHRRARRSSQQAKVELLYPEGKTVKVSALRQVQYALSLITEADVEGALAEDIPEPAPHTGAPIQTSYDLDMDKAPITASAYIARFLRQTEEDRRQVTIEEVRNLSGFRVFKWDGRTSHVLLDKHQRGIGLLEGRPNDPSWANVNRELAAIIRIIGSAYRLPAARKANRRGDFDTISCGISYGGGQKRLGNFAMSAHNYALWRTVFKLRAFRRVVNFVNTSFKVFFPKLHQYYTSTLSSVCENDPKLRRNYDDSAFAAISINLGPRAISFVHTDHLNLAFGLCAITAVGDFDPSTGGHLILWDLGLIIEFPPGSTILIPSALLRHSNTALAKPEENRYAILQYSAGGIFRWAECGFQSQKAFLAAGNKSTETGRDRWEKGVGMFSYWPELQERAMRAVAA